jgi:heme-degrading monooxygenase HmoA
MFIAVYEFEVVEGKEREFRKYWLETTGGIYEECGSFGSRLHKSNTTNVYVGYAQWPSKEVWRKGEIRKEDHLLARAKMNECLVSSTTVYEMEVTDDYLQPAEYKA